MAMDSPCYEGYDSYDEEFEMEYDSEYEVPRVPFSPANTNTMAPSRIFVLKAEHKLPKRPTAIASPTRSAVRRLRARRLSSAPLAKHAILAEPAQKQTSAIRSRSASDLPKSVVAPAALPSYVKQRARSAPPIRHEAVGATPAIGELGASIRSSGREMLLPSAVSAVMPRAARIFYDPTTGKQTYLRC